MERHSKYLIIFTGIIIIALFFMLTFNYSTKIKALQDQIIEKDNQLKSYEESIKNLQEDSIKKSELIKQLTDENSRQLQVIEEMELEIILLDEAVHMIGIEDVETLLTEYAQIKKDYEDLLKEYQKLLKETQNSP
jgi:FMN-dependent NADH-azoreductase